MMRVRRTAFLLAVVLVLMLGMSAAAVARPVNKNGPPARDQAPARDQPPAALGADPIVYANDTRWVTTGIWKLEKYTMLPDPWAEPPWNVADLLVANDAGATATFDIPEQAARNTRFTLYGSRYWQGGMADVYMKQEGVVKDTAAVDFYLDADSPQWGQPLYTYTFPNNGRNWSFEIVARGSGSCPEPGLHFVNVQYIQYNY